jgi:pimeloyl-ACP methyl ester carboxylesterase
MRRHWLVAALVTLAAVLVAFLSADAVDLAARPAGTSSAVLVRSQASFPITRDGVTLTLPVFVSQPLTKADSRVTRAVIVLHGAEGNAAGYWDYAAAGLKGVSGLLLVAPKFAVTGETVTASQLSWASSGAWTKGGVSVATNRAWTISSFEVLDGLIARLRAAFPNARSIVVVGHSAGGQLAQRYAAMKSDTSLRFVIMNPSSYLYLSPERPSGNETFAVPSQPPVGYDDYKYGLEDLNDIRYVETIGAQALRSRYLAAHVSYLLGELDTGTADADLDVTPAAMLQGTCRRERGEQFFAYLGAMFGTGVYERHTLAIVPAVGHSAGGMFRSVQARAAMLQ